MRQMEREACNLEGWRVLSEFSLHTDGFELKNSVVEVVTFLTYLEGALL